jgi:hypothetical protein
MPQREWYAVHRVRLGASVLRPSTGILLSRYEAAAQTLTPLTNADWYTPAVDDAELRERLIALCLEKDAPQIVSNKINRLWFGVPLGRDVYIIGPCPIVNSEDRKAGKKHASGIADTPRSPRRVPMPENRTSRPLPPCGRLS